MEKNYESIAMKVSVVSLVVNIFLSIGKLIAGLLASSGAMVSDAVHSASDVFSTVIVMIGIKIAGKPSDDDHPYGHERMECAASIILAAVLALTGVQLGLTAFRSIGSPSVKIPGMLAVIAAVVSIVVKEAMYQFTKHYAKKINSTALLADAWHHRSDALSSIGALAGIGASMLGFKYGDPIASVIICLFILKAAYDIFKEALDKMVDKSCDEKTEEQMKDFIKKQPGVEKLDLLNTRTFGNRVYMDVEISADGNLSLVEAHDIAQRVHDSIEKKFPEVKHIMVHVNPKEV